MKIFILISVCSLLANEFTQNVLEAYSRGESIDDFLESSEFRPNYQNDKGHTLLHIAAEKNDLNLVKRIVKRTNINLADNTGADPAIVAAYFGHVKLIGLLTHKNYHFERRSDEGRSALVYLLRGGHDKAALALLKKYPFNLDATVEDLTISMLAMRYKNHQVVDYILKNKKLDLSQRSPIGTTYPMFMAKYGNFENYLAFERRYTFDPNEVDMYGRNMAMMVKDPSIMKKVMEKENLDSSRVDMNGRNLIVYLSDNGFAEYISKFRVDTTLEDHVGVKLGFYLLEKGHLHFAKEVDLSVVNSEGNSLLKEIFLKNDPENFKLLNHINIKELSEEERNLFFNFSFEHNNPIIREIIPFVKLSRSEIETILDIAVTSNDLELLKVVVKKIKSKAIDLWPFAKYALDKKLINVLRILSEFLPKTDLDRVLISLINENDEDGLLRVVKGMNPEKIPVDLAGKAAKKGFKKYLEFDLQNMNVDEATETLAFALSSDDKEFILKILDTRKVNLKEGLDYELYNKELLSSQYVSEDYVPSNKLLEHILMSEKEFPEFLIDHINLNVKWKHWEEFFKKIIINQTSMIDKLIDRPGFPTRLVYLEVLRYEPRFDALKKILDSKVDFNNEMMGKIALIRLEENKTSEFFEIVEAPRFNINQKINGETFFNLVAQLKLEVVPRLMDHESYSPEPSYFMSIASNDELAEKFIDHEKFEQFPKDRPWPLVEFIKIGNMKLFRKVLSKLKVNRNIVKLIVETAFNSKNYELVKEFMGHEFYDINGTLKYGAQEGITFSRAVFKDGNDELMEILLDSPKLVLNPNMFTNIKNKDHLLGKYIELKGVKWFQSNAPWPLVEFIKMGKMDLFRKALSKIKLNADILVVIIETAFTAKNFEIVKEFMVNPLYNINNNFHFDRSKVISFPRMVFTEGNQELMKMVLDSPQLNLAKIFPQAFSYPDLRKQVIEHKNWNPSIILGNTETLLMSAIISNSHEWAEILYNMDGVDLDFNEDRYHHHTTTALAIIHNSPLLERLIRRPGFNVKRITQLMNLAIDHKNLNAILLLSELPDFNPNLSSERNRNSIEMIIANFEKDDLRQILHAFFKRGADFSSARGCVLSALPEEIAQEFRDLLIVGVTEWGKPVLPKVSTGEVSCSVCLGDIEEGTEFFEGPSGCECAVCSDCLASTLQEIEAGNDTCPFCNTGNIHASFIEGASGRPNPELCLNVHRKRLSTIPYFDPCPREGCVGGSVFRPDMRDQWTKCEKCFSERYLTHRSVSAADEEWVRQRTRPCPRCKANIEKIEGCNHMTCKNSGCNHEFLWSSLQDFHKRCPSFFCGARVTAGSYQERMDRARCHTCDNEFTWDRASRY